MQLAELDHSLSKATALSPEFTVGDTDRLIAVETAVTELATLPLDSPRRKIYEMQLACQALPEVDFPLWHSFAPGVYLRTIFLPKNSLIVGKIHKHAHANIVLSGHVRVYTEHEQEQEFIAPLQMISKPGTKRVVLALEDTMWMTIHPTKSTDLAEIEKEVIATNYEEYEAFVKQQGVLL
jgi:hypothetical protein